MKIILLIVIQLTLASSVYSETYHQWTDEKGVVHYSDSPPAQESMAHQELAVSSKISIQEKERELTRVYLKGRQLFKKKKYDEALSIFHDIIKEYEDFYSVNPDRFKSRSNHIMDIRTKLAGYYRWKEGKPQKALTEYRKLIDINEKFEISEKRIYPIWFLMGEIYEKELNDYNQALRCYQNVTELMKVTVYPADTALFNKGAIDWHEFLIEKINVLYLKKRLKFSKRTIKYPSVEYSSFISFFGNAFAFSEISFIDEDFMNYASEYKNIEAMDKLFSKYPTSYQMMFFGINLFYNYLSENDMDKAMTVADRLFAAYPGDLNMVMLQFQIADVYKEQNDEAKSKEATGKGLQMADALNMTMVLGADKRFSTPEKTWQLFITSLEKRDIDEAVTCFSPSSQAKYRKAFTQLNDKLDKMAEDMKEIRKINEDEGRMEYEIIREENGKKFSYGIYFTNVFGEWKIEQF